ncbi:MAG: LysR family transcriptional regulator [Pseudomonadota bacterium]
MIDIGYQSSQAGPELPSLASIQGRVRLRQLALVLAIEERGSLRRAAEALSVSQPAATKMLSELEQSLGLQLFERGARGMEPTLFGQAVVRYAHLILTDLQGLREELSALAAGRAGKVSVGTIMAAAPVLLSDTIAELKQKHPSLEISVTMETSDVLVPMLEQGRLDVVIGRQTEGAELAGLHFEPLYSEALSVVTGPGHALAGRPALTLADLSGQSWILQPRSSPMRKLIEASFRDAGLDPPADVLETNSVLTTTSLLKQTHMVAVLPTSVATYYAENGMLSLLSVRLEKQLDAFGAITRRQRMQPPALRQLLASLRARSLTSK